MEEEVDNADEESSNLDYLGNQQQPE